MDCHLDKLIEHLVARAAQEVAVHQLDQRPPAFQSIADRRADNRGLGDRAVEQAMVGQDLRQAAVDGERAAPVPVLLAIGDQRRVHCRTGAGPPRTARRGRRGTSPSAAVRRSRQFRSGCARQAASTRGFSASGVQQFRLARGVERFDLLVGEHRLLQQAAHLIQVGARRKFQVDRALVSAPGSRASISALRSCPGPPSCRCRPRRDRCYRCTSESTCCHASISAFSR